MWLEKDVQYLRTVEPDQAKETVILPLINARNNYTTLNPGERAYFDPNTVLSKVIITAVEVIPTAPFIGRLISLAQSVGNPAFLAGFTLTLIDIHGRRVIENSPLHVFYNSQNGGKIRRFEMPDINLQASYVTAYNGAYTNSLYVIPFQFSYKERGSDN